jgi:hypothetical protein
MLDSTQEIRRSMGTGTRAKLKTSSRELRSFAIMSPSKVRPDYVVAAVDRKDRRATYI